MVKEYYKKYQCSPSFDTLEQISKSEFPQEMMLRILMDTIKQIQNAPFEGSNFVQDKALKFCKQQELQKVMTKAQKIIDASGQPKPEKLNVAKIGRNWEVIDQWGESVSKHKTKMEAEGEVQRMQSGAGTLPNVDLHIGDKPMKVFYDEMIPNYLNAFGKKYGAQVKDRKSTRLNSSH